MVKSIWIVVILCTVVAGFLLRRGVDDAIAHAGKSTPDLRTSMN